MLLELKREASEIWLRDLGSTSGTMAAPLRAEALDQLLRTQSSQKTATQLTLDSLTRFTFAPVTQISSRLPNTAIVMAGVYFFIVTIS
jgi:hypothetical protein